ncbi:GerMN domain-containing protein [Streptomyces lasiicapitis]|uniref:Lipoprotein n=1 Tax=Streptomyces lasiicapitis TaxID=1923961 RepID=A0ABQ2LND4_9ACTN|nr:GerMN domain-containing protein [Streptomyces lasiicapitis]GGO40948.1 lipoprotein [Streptomyces lasiicapitis]
MRRQLACLAAVLGLLAAGCGIGSTGPVRAGAPASGLREPGSTSQYAQLYFVSPNGIQAVTREVDTPATPQQALDLLLKGPDAAERARGLITEVPPIHGRLLAEAADGAVDLRLPVPVARMTGGGGLGLSQIICTAANARVPDGKQPPDVDVHVYEEGYGTPWTVRCNAAGNVVPVSRPAPSRSAPSR